MNNQNSIFKIIKEEAQKGNHEAVKKYCKTAFQIRNLNKNQMRIIKDAFTSIAKRYEREKLFSEAIIALEYYRKMFPFNVSILTYEIELFTKFYDSYKQKMSEQDNELFIECINRIIEPYKSLKQKSYNPPIEIAEKLILKIKGEIFVSPHEIDLKVTEHIVNVFDSVIFLMFRNLNSDERREEICKYLSKGLRKSAQSKGILIKQETSKPKKSKGAN